MNKKLDPGLRSRLRAARGGSEAKAASQDRTAGERIGIIVEFTGNLDDLTAVGFERHSLVEHPTKGYKMRHRPVTEAIGTVIGVVATHTACMPECWKFCHAL